MKYVTYLKLTSYKSIPSFELPQPTINISSLTFIYLCNCPHSSLYSPYLNKKTNQYYEKKKRKRKHLL